MALFSYMLKFDFNSGRFMLLFEEAHEKLEHFCLYIIVETAKIQNCVKVE